MQFCLEQKLKFESEWPRVMRPLHAHERVQNNLG